MDDQLIRAQAGAAEISCGRISPSRLQALRESFEEACRLPAETGWEQRAAAHAAFFTVLAEAAAGNPAAAALLASGGELARELMITAGRGQAAAVAATVDWLANFLLIEVFPVWQNAISLGAVLVCFAALALAAIAFIYWFLPETKGLPVEEIVTLFERNRRAVK